MDFSRVVFIQHEYDGKDYLFTVPIQLNLRQGDKVICDTMHGIVPSVCASDSFIIPEVSIGIIADRIGAYLPLKPILGTLPQSWNNPDFMSGELPF